MIPVSLLLTPLLLQAPDDGWGVVRSRPREVTQIYWELLKTTEVFVRLTPTDADGKPVRVNLVFQAFFPGRAERDSYSGRPLWPKGPPARLTPADRAALADFADRIGLPAAGPAK